MEIRKKDEEITYEVTLKGDKYDCVLKNFFLDGEDYNIRDDSPLPGGLAHASKENILEKTFEETIFFHAEALKRDSEKSGNEEKKEQFLSVAKALESLDYDKISKNLIRL